MITFSPPSPHDCLGEFAAMAQPLPRHATASLPPLPRDAHLPDPLPRHATATPQHRLACQNAAFVSPSPPLTLISEPPLRSSATPQRPAAPQSVTPQRPGATQRDLILDPDRARRIFMALGLRRWGQAGSAGVRSGRSGRRRRRDPSMQQTAWF